MIGAWLAGKLSGIIIFCIACLSIVLLPAVMVQTVRINGISFFGLYAINGYKPMYERLLADNGTLLANQSTLTLGIQKCNASVDGIKAASDKVTAAAQILADQAKLGQTQIAGNISAMRSIKSSTEVCPVADAILHMAFQ